MSKSTKDKERERRKHAAEERRRNKRYTRKTFGKSVFDNSPTLVIYEYKIPNVYKKPVHDVLTAFKSDIPFNKAVDQVATLYKGRVNRDKLAEHTLKYIANEN